MTIQYNFNESNSFCPIHEIPHSWYHKLTKIGGKPDTVGVIVLADLLYLSNYHQTSRLKFRYKDFKQRLNLTLSQARDALNRLGELKLISRYAGKDNDSNRCWFENIMFITINREEIEKLSKNSNTKDSNNNFTGNSNNDNSKKLAFKNSYNEVESSELSTDNKKDNYIYKNRSIRSESNFFREKEKAIKCGTAISANDDFPKSLVDFHPMNEKAVELLTAKSGREFNSRFVNLLLLRLAAKYPEKVFTKNEKFMNYMIKVLVNELRQAAQVNNEDFNFRVEENSKEENSKIEKVQNKLSDFKDKNVSNSSSQTLTVDQYLRAIEQSTDESCIGQLKKKIVSGFERNIAYILLTRCQFIGEDTNNTFHIIVDKGLTLSNIQQQTILFQVQTVFRDSINKLNVTSNKLDSCNSHSDKHQTTDVYQFNRNELPLFNYNHDIQNFERNLNNEEVLDKFWMNKLKVFQENNHVLSE